MLVHKDQKEVAKTAISKRVLSNLNVKLQWNSEFKSKAFRLTDEAR